MNEAIVKNKIQMKSIDSTSYIENNKREQNQITNLIIVYSNTHLYYIIYIYIQTNIYYI